MRFVLLLPAVLAFCTCAAEYTTIKGRVLDAVSRAPLAYVSISASPHAYPTTALIDGRFEMTLWDTLSSDTVVFVLLGHERTVVHRSHWANGPVDVLMRPRTEELPPLEVSAVRLEERRIGVRTHHPLFTYLLEAQDPLQILEMAQAIELGPTPVKVVGVNVFIGDSPMDSLTYRIAFRNYDGERPTGPLVHRSLVRRIPATKGWQRLDLSTEGIVLKGPVVVTLELLPDPSGTPRSISCGIRLGGGLPGFDRRSAFDDWNRPPHRYSIHIVALVPKDRAKEKEEDPEPFVRSVDTRLWSQAVQDTFSIAFGLPDGFDPLLPEGYPTVYLLDANAYFEDVVAAFRKAARKGRLPPVIVVGVGYRDFVTMDSLRQRDYLVPPSDSVPNSGGGDRFLHFLSDELAPYVKQRYRLQGDRCVLAGHSFGGYFVLHALQQGLRGDVLPFTDFIAASPEVEYGEEVLRRELARDGPPSTGEPRVHITTGFQEDGPAMKAYVTELRRSLGARMTQGSYPKADHMGTALPSFVDGLRALLREQAE